VTAIGALIVVAIIGVITWVVIGVRQRASEPATFAGAGSFYAHIMSIVGVTMALVGGAVLIKALLAFADLGYSYQQLGFFGQSCTSNSSGVSTCTNNAPAFDATPQRTADLILAGALILIGAAVVYVHRALSRNLATLPGGHPGWVHRGTVIAFTLLFGFAAVFSLATGLSSLVTYFATSGTPSTVPLSGVPVGNAMKQPFGDAIGAAVVFVPAWIFAVRALLHAIRPGAAASPAPPPVHGTAPAG
jgi:hypothetical protein